MKSVKYHAHHNKWFCCSYTIFINVNWNTDHVHTSKCINMGLLSEFHKMSQKKGCSNCTSKYLVHKYIEQKHGFLAVRNVSIALHPWVTCLWIINYYIIDLLVIFISHSKMICLHWVPGQGVWLQPQYHLQTHDNMNSTYQKISCPIIGW